MNKALLVLSGWLRNKCELFGIITFGRLEIQLASFEEVAQLKNNRQRAVNRKK